MRTAKKVNRSSKTIIVLTVIVGVFMFALNYMTPMLVDDYTYCYSFADGKKITSLLQIFPSMANHYQTMNGKVIVHGVFQFLLMFPQGLFDVLNSFMACLLCYVIYMYVWRIHHDEENAVLYFFVIASLWLYVHSFGHVFLWSAGSLNYLWTTVVLLLYIKPVYTDFSYKRSKAYWVLYILAGFVMGTLVESTSFAIIGFYFLWAAEKRILKKEKVELYKLLPIVSMSCGYLVLLLSPAGQGKVKVRRGLLNGILLSTKMYFTSYIVLLVIGVFLTAFLLLFGLEKQKLKNALIWIFLSYGMHCMLSVAAYHPGRSEAGIGVFLIIGDGILLSMVFDHAIKSAQDSWNQKVTWICRSLTAYICLFFLYQMCFVVPIGVEAIHTSWKQILKDENYIKEKVKEGEKDITVPVVTSVSPYAAVYQLTYVNTSRCDTWPNESMAKYYGAARIYGTD